MVGLWLISRRERVVGGSRDLSLAVLAGLGFGGFFVLIAQADTTTAVVWPIITARVTGFSILLLIAVANRGTFRGGRGGLPLMFLAGVLEVGGIAFFLLAIHAGRLDVAARSFLPMSSRNDHLGLLAA